MASERTIRRVPGGQLGVLPSSRSHAFWLVAYTFVVVMLGSMLPSPLYVIYQQMWGFSAGMITVIFAVYAAGTLLALVMFGELSDRDRPSQQLVKLRNEHHTARARMIAEKVCG